MNFMDFMPQFGQNIPNQDVGAQDDISAQLLLKRRLAQADALRNQEMPQGQMVSGHYVAPSWTQALANLYSKYQSGQEEREAIKGYQDYQAGKQAKYAEALKEYEDTLKPRIEEAPQQPTTVMGFTGEMAPNMGMVNAPAKTIMPTASDRYNALMRFSAKTQNPELAQRAMLGDIERANRAEETTAERAWREKQTANEQEFQRIQQKDRQGFELTQQEKNFANQMALQKSSQGFQAGENAKNRQFQESNAALVSVLDSITGKPKLVTRAQALGQQPYSAAQEAKDVLKVQQNKNAEVSTQDTLNQAERLFNHPGLNSGTGLGGSTMSSIPGTDARDFKAQLDTFKAQTFVPMVQALKGMGALSDAEGKKLTDSVGALDQGVSPKDFRKNLMQATKTLYEKAKAAGLNVQMPSFIMEDGGTQGQGQWSIKKVQ